MRIAHLHGRTHYSNKISKSNQTDVSSGLLWKHDYDDDAECLSHTIYVYIPRY